MPVGSDNVAYSKPKINYKKNHQVGRKRRFYTFNFYQRFQTIIAKKNPTSELMLPQLGLNWVLATINGYEYETPIAIGTKGFTINLNNLHDNINNWQ